ncbi:MAG: hypothetical protein COT73_09465, partial [Bdellovibrio sp. CG10_big_fil_rev_8_21_14_0_10_47_8]
MPLAGLIQILLKPRLLTVMSAVGMFLMTPVADAQYVPQTVAFQGYLTNSTGTAITATTDLRFGIYIDSSRVWYADYASVAFSAGRFSVALGD